MAGIGKEIEDIDAKVAKFASIPEDRTGPNERRVTGRSVQPFVALRSSR
jgi:hypothetical protein